MDLNPATIPEGHWLSSSNMMVRNGVVVPRPGYADIGNGAMPAGDRITGAFARGALQSIYGDVPIIQTHTKTYAVVIGGSTYDITGSWTTSSLPTRFCHWQQSNQYWNLRVNPDNAVDYWDGALTPTSYTDIAAAPNGNDVCTVGPYVVVGGTKASGTNERNWVSWCAANDATTWPAGNVNHFREYVGEVTAVRAMNQRSFIAFQSVSLSIGSLQAAKTAFQFAQVQWIEGPLGPGWVCLAYGKVYWLGHNGVFYVFDGARVEKMSDSIEPWLRSELGLQLSSSVFVCSSRWENGGKFIVFFFNNTSATAYASIILNVETGAIYPCILQDDIAAAYTVKYGIGSAYVDYLFGGGTDSKVWAFNPATKTDNGTAIPWNFEFGYRPLTDVEDRGKLDGVSSYFKKTSSSCTVTVSVTLSDGIDDSETATTDTFDTNTAGNHLKTFRSLDPKKWIKLKYSGTQAVDDLEYRGSIVTAWERSMI